MGTPKDEGILPCLRIERMAYGADAIAHDDGGRVVFVSGGVPGDVVDVRVTQEKGRFAHGTVKSVVEASPLRVDVPHPYVEQCGGCPWANLAYEAQLTAKRANVTDALVRIGRFPQERAEALVAACVASPKPWGYRNKIELAVATQQGRTTIGMHDRLGRGVATFRGCPLLDTHHDKFARSIVGALSYLTGTRELGLERVAIRASTRTSEIEVALWTRPGDFPRGQVAKVLSDATKGQATSIVRVLTKGPRGARRVIGVERLLGRGSWSERVGKERMRLSAPSFFQVNTKGAEVLVDLVMGGLSPTEDEVAMDLYSGVGTFTLPLARRTSWVSAVESSGPAVRDLRRNLEGTGLDDVDVIGGDANREFPTGGADIIVVDPPRAGLTQEVVEKLSDQRARAIAYVSCDPATLARDLARFKEAGSFFPLAITPVDLFPQTFHVECVALLARR